RRRGSAPLADRRLASFVPIRRHIGQRPMTSIPAQDRRDPDDARWLAFVEPLRAFLRKRVPAGVDAEDVAQEVFLRIARHRATLGDVDDLEAWIFRVARTALTDAWRAERRRAARASEADPGELPEPEEDP